MRRLTTVLVAGMYFSLTSYCLCSALFTGQIHGPSNFSDALCAESPAGHCDDHHGGTEDSHDHAEPRDHGSSDTSDTCCVKVATETPVILSTPSSAPSRNETAPIVWLGISFNAVLLTLNEGHSNDGHDPPPRTGRPLRDSPESPRAPPFSA